MGAMVTSPRKLEARYMLQPCVCLCPRWIVGGLEIADDTPRQQGCRFDPQTGACKFGLSRSSTASKMSNEEKLAQFVAVTGAGPDEALHLLEASGWDMDSAVQLHFDSLQAGAPQDDELVARQMMQEDLALPEVVGAGLPATNLGHPAVDQDGVRVPDAARTERLFDGGMEMMAARPRPRRELAEGASISLGGPGHSDGGLDAIYKPPQAIMNDMTLEEYVLTTDACESCAMCVPACTPHGCHASTMRDSDSHRVSDLFTPEPGTQD